MLNRYPSRTVDALLTPNSLPRPISSVRVDSQRAKPSSHIRMCLWLIYYFTLSDSLLKFLPLPVAVPLRYLPDVFLYLLMAMVMLRSKKFGSFPLLWPLCACALTMAISGILNSSSIYGVLSDYRSFFRFAAFTYIGWRLIVTPQRIAQFINGFLVLTVVELIVGALELFGGSGVQALFAPALGWGSGTLLVQSNMSIHPGTWISGTLSDYNQYGFFMTMSMIAALAMYFMKGANRYLWIAAGSALAVLLSFSRHSLPMMVLSLGVFFYFQRKRFSTTALVRGAFLVIIVGFALVSLGEDFGSAFQDRLQTLTSTGTLHGDRTANIRLYMILQLTPRFLTSFPFFGQGPITQSDAIPIGEKNTSRGIPLKAAPDLTGSETFYFGDVVWVMILGLYGGCGVVAFGYVFWSMAAAANKVRKGKQNLENIVLAQACVISVCVLVTSGFFSLEMIARDCTPIVWFLAGMVMSLATNPRLSGRRATCGPCHLSSHISQTSVYASQIISRA